MLWILCHDHHSDDWLINGSSPNSSFLCVILDRHQVWRSHDPTSVQTFDFCEKKDVIPPFLKKTQLVVVHIYFFHIFLKDATLPPSHPPPGYPPSGFPPGYLMLPNLTNQFISYPMAIFSAKYLTKHEVSTVPQNA